MHGTGAAWANIAIGTHKQYTSHKSGTVKSVSHESSMVRQYTDAYQSHSNPSTTVANCCMHTVGHVIVHAFYYAIGMH